MGYLKRAVQGAGIVFVMSILSAFIAYLTRIFLARSLNPEGYGLFYAVFTFVIFFLFFRDLGLGSALVKYIAEFRVNKENNKIKTAIVSVFSIQFLSSVIFSIFFIFFAFTLAEKYFQTSNAVTILLIFVIYVIFSVLFRNIKSFFQGFQEMFLYSSVEFIKNFLVLSLVIIFYKLGHGLYSPVWAYALVGPIIFLIYLPFMLKMFDFFKYKITDFKGISKKMITFGIPVFATSVGSKFIGYLDTLVLTYFGTLTQVGIYNVVLPSAIIFLFIGRAVGSVIFPMSSEMWKKNDKKKLAEGLKLIHRYIFALTVPMIGTFFVYSELFITTFFGSEYSSGALAFQILLVGVLFYTVALVNNTMISGIGKPKIVTKIILVSAFLNTILNFALIPKYGIEGAAFATTLSYLIVLVYSTSAVTKEIKAPFPLKDWLVLSFPAVIFVFIMFALRILLDFSPFLEAIFVVFVSIVIYMVMLYLLRIFRIKDVKRQLKFLR